MADVVLFRLNRSKLQLLGLKNDLGVFVNSATVLASMLDLNGAAIPEITNATLVSINSSGDYSYTIPGTFSPAAGFGYMCKITATADGLPDLEIEKPVTVEVRTS